MTLLITSNTQDRLEQQPETPSTIVAEAQSPLALPITLKLGSAAFALFVASVNDGSLGVLLPYALRGYHISTGSVAILYGTAFAGWDRRCTHRRKCTRTHRFRRCLGPGASSQLVAFALRVWVSLTTANWLEKLLSAETLTCVCCTGTAVWCLLCHVLARGLGSSFPRLAGEYFRFGCQDCTPLVGRRARKLWFWMSCWSSDCYSDCVSEAREVDMVLLALAWTRRG